MSTKNWDEIDLGELRMEDPAESSEASYAKRQERYSAREIAIVVETQPSKGIEATIQNLTSHLDSSGLVLDLSASGAKIISAHKCSPHDILRISFNFGSHRIVCQAKVSWAKSDDNGFVAGVQFIAPKKEDVDLIKSIPSALHLR